MSSEPQQTCRIWKKTHALLRILAALSGERMLATLHRIVQAEYDRVAPRNPG